jgi:hypothetical protein
MMLQDHCCRDQKFRDQEEERPLSTSIEEGKNVMAEKILVSLSP